MIASLLVILTFGVLVLGGGVLVMFALRLPRLGLASALWLSVWLALTLAFAMPFGWRWWLGEATLLVINVACGVLIIRNRAKLLHKLPYSPLDGALFVVLALVFIVPALVLPVPLDTDAQGFGYLALMARLSGSLTTLAPWQPEIDYLYAPGFSVIVAYLSERLVTPMHSTQFGAAAVLAVVFLLVLYDFGVELGGVVRARAHVIAAMIGTGLFTAYMDSHYTSVIGLLIGSAFLAFVYRLISPPSPFTTNGVGEQHRSKVSFLFTAEGSRGGVIYAALCLAALVLVHPDTTIIIGLGFGAWLLLMPVANPRPPVRQWVTAAVIVPVIAFIMVLPWLLSVLHLLGSDIASPFERFPYHWQIVLGFPPQILYHGGVIVLISLVGLVIGLRQRRHEALLAVGWLLLILDFSTFGILEHTLPFIVAPIVRYDYPFSLAWHGPIIPYMLLGGLALDFIWRLLPNNIMVGGKRAAPLLVGSLAVLVILGGLFNREILALSKGRVTFFGAFASHADVAAMSWLRENTAEDAYILNFPGPQEGDWVPVIAERQSVYYRPQPFFQRNDEDSLADTPEQVAMRAFWQDPANAEHETLLRDAGVDYVIVPQVIGNPASFESHYRWRRPFTDLIEMQSDVADADYLELAYDADGAQVYQFGE